jgi:hypothetical protein
VSIGLSKKQKNAKAEFSHKTGKRINRIWSVGWFTQNRKVQMLSFTHWKEKWVVTEKMNSAFLGRLQIISKLYILNHSRFIV